MIVFHELTQAEVKSIVDLLVARVRTQLESQAIDLALSDAAKTRLAEMGYDPQLGARPLRRAIQATKSASPPVYYTIKFAVFAAPAAGLLWLVLALRA